MKLYIQGDKPAAWLRLPLIIINDNYLVKTKVPIRSLTKPQTVKIISL